MTEAGRHFLDWWQGREYVTVTLDFAEAEVALIEAEAAARAVSEALAKVRGEVVALIEEHGGLCVVSGDPEDPICETHSEMMFDGFCEDDPRDLRAVLAILDAASGGGGER